MLRNWWVQLFLFVLVIFSSISVGMQTYASMADSDGLKVWPSMLDTLTDLFPSSLCCLAASVVVVIITIADDSGGGGSGGDDDTTAIPITTTATMSAGCCRQHRRCYDGHDASRQAIEKVISIVFMVEVLLCLLQHGIEVPPSASCNMVSKSVAYIVMATWYRGLWPI